MANILIGRPGKPLYLRAPPRQRQQAQQQAMMPKEDPDAAFKDYMKEEDGASMPLSGAHFFAGWPMFDKKNAYSGGKNCHFVIKNNV